MSKRTRLHVLSMTRPSDVVPAGSRSNRLIRESFTPKTVPLRCRLLETLRDFALERAQGVRSFFGPGQADAVQRARPAPAPKQVYGRPGRSGARGDASAERAFDLGELPFIS
jgi:hypothetical protein